MASTFTAFPDDSEFLDALPLRENGHELEEFDLFGMYDERILSSSKNSLAMDFQVEGRNLVSSKNSLTMDYQVEVGGLSESIKSFHFDEVYEEPQQDEVASSQQHQVHNYNSRIRMARGRSPSPSRKRYQVKHGYSITDNIETLTTERAVSSHNDEVSICTHNSTLTDASSCFSASPSTQAEYNERLEKLTLSMKRTEESRRQVMMQRELQHTAVEQVRQQQQASSSGAPRPLSPGRSTVMSSFFSGNRNTLTNGLEHSRRQLRMYMNQINNQSL